MPKYITHVVLVELGIDMFDRDKDIEDFFEVIDAKNADEAGNKALQLAREAIEENGYRFEPPYDELDLRAVVKKGK